MDNLYSRFLGIGFRNGTSGRENKYLSKSSSAPFYLSFQARQLPTSLSGEIPIKKRNGGITSSDIKVQILEEKIRNYRLQRKFKGGTITGSASGIENQETEQKAKLLPKIELEIAKGILSG